jgi:hypothetical protein
MVTALARTSAEVPESAVFPAAGVASTGGLGRPSGTDTVEHWEIHSELTLVSPEVRRHALEVLAREHTLHLLRCRAAEGEEKHASKPAPFPVALGVYLARVVALTLVLAFVVAGGTVAFAVALELLRRW